MTGPVTPGPQFPGAYPPTPFDTVSTSTTKDPALAVSAGINQVAGATSSLANAGTTAFSAGVDSVKETLYSAAQYLPPKVVEYFPGGTAIVAASSTEDKLRDAQGFDVSLPSREHESELDTAPLVQDRVEPLSSPASQAGIAKLSTEDTTNSELQVHTPFTSPDGLSPPKDSMTDISTIAQAGSDVGHSTPQIATSIPSGSLGDVTGRFKEHVPATSSPTHPSKNDKPIEPMPLNLEPRTHPLAREGGQWKGVPLDESYQRDVVDRALDNLHLSDTQAQPQSETSNPIASSISPSSLQNKSLPRIPARNEKSDSTTADVGHEGPSSNLKFSGPGNVGAGDTDTTTNVTSTSNSDLHSSSSLNDQNRTHEKNVSVASTASGSEYVSGSVSGSESVDNATGAHVQRKKTKILTKLKGEVKIISGKLGGKEEKVEEGRRMMRGEM
ncbi:hypothetical protein D9757_010518 [Collybiopsis confluens]|uniref:Uncharacterized protein n=1 Tax=Collybiopsis confluens TaxID=2823264 RepID=A0A8H5GNR4_9AGAR|nr:hypothetical protein D9757_010518 [Collybiopsis confluens]